MNKYELTYIIDTAVEETARAALVEKFTQLIKDNGGEVSKVDEAIWGKRRLAYPINYKTEGYYVLTSFEAESNVPVEIEHNLMINESVLRYMIVKLEDRKVGIKPRAARPVAAPVEEAVEAAPVEEAVEAPVAE